MNSRRFIIRLLVGAGEKRRWYGEPKRHGGLEVEHPSEPQTVVCHLYGKRH